MNNFFTNGLLNQNPQMPTPMQPQGLLGAPQPQPNLMAGLFGGGLMGQDVGLSDEFQKRAQQQAMLQAGLAMMAGSSRQVGPKRGLGEILAGGLQAGTQGYQGALRSGMAGQAYKEKQDEKRLEAEARKAAGAAGQGIDWKTSEGWAQYADRLAQIPGRENDAVTARKQALELGKKTGGQQKLADLEAFGVDPNSAEGKKYLGTYIEPKTPRGFINAGDGNLFNQDTGQFIQAPNAGKPKIRMMTGEELAAAGLPPTTKAQIDNNGKIMPITGTEGSGRVPAALIKLETEDLADLATAQNTATDIAALRQQITDGSLNLGPIENLKSRAKNATGFSDANSQNFVTFKASMEKLRNDSLRLNKGVQTEGDAVREWNALFENINDEKAVAKRLEEIEKLNKRAAQERQFIIQQRRTSVNAPDFDFSQMPQGDSVISNAAQNPGGGDMQSAAQAELKRRGLK